MSTTGPTGGGHRGIHRRDGIHVVLGEHGEEEEEPDDHDRDHRVEDLDGDVLVKLSGHLVGAPPVAEDGPQDQEEDQATDDDAGGHHARVELEGLLALGGGPAAGAVAGVEIATAEHQGCSDGQDDRPAPPSSGLVRVARARSVRRRKRGPIGAARRAWPTGCECFHGDDTSWHTSRIRSSGVPRFGPGKLPVHRGGDGGRSAAFRSVRRSCTPVPRGTCGPREHPLRHGRGRYFGAAGEHGAAHLPDARVIRCGQPGQLGQVPGQAHGGVGGVLPK